MDNYRPGILTTAMGGEVGILLDARGRPLAIPETPEEQRKQMIEWFKVMNLYDKEW